MLDFNRSVFQAKTANVAINDAIDAALDQRLKSEPKREYLGASSIGSDCLRRIQWDWTSPVTPDARAAKIFARGHWSESESADLLFRAGFTLQRGGPEIGFLQAGGRFRGHCDGIVRSGPEIEGVGYPALWEHKCLGSKGWAKIERDGLAKAYPTYADQVALYQAYLGLTEHPAIFTVTNADNCVRLHLLVPYDPARAQAASDRAVAVLNAETAGETLPRVAVSQDDWRCKMCPHRARCWA